MFPSHDFIPNTRVATAICAAIFVVVALVERLCLFVIQPRRLKRHVCPANAVCFQCARNRRAA